MLTAALAALALAGGGSSAGASSRCHGKWWVRSSGAIRFHFWCHHEAVRDFRIHANRRIKRADDPSGAFGCSRLSRRTFECEDQHAGAPDSGYGRLRVKGAPCSPDLELHVKWFPDPDVGGDPVRFELVGSCPGAAEPAR